MRLLAITAAALLVTGISITPAAARPGWHGNGHRHGWHGHHHRRCTTVWRHHHRVRRCW